MKPKKFEYLISKIADDWYLDANDCVKGTFKQAGKPKGPRRKINRDGEALEPNTSIHRVHILKLKSYFEVCKKCGIINENPVHVIDIKAGTMRNKKCGCVLPHFTPYKKHKN